MSMTVNVSDIVDDVVFRLHVPAVGATGFLTTTAMTAQMKRSVGRLGSMLTRTFGDNYWARTATLTTQAGLDLVSLPTDFTTLTSLHWVDGDRALLLERAHDTDYSPLATSWTSAPLPWGLDAGKRAKYVLEAGVIRLTPPPAAVYTLRCAYQTRLSIASLTDTFQAQDDSWAEWVALDLCEVIRSREDKDASNFVARRMEIEAKLKDQAFNRDRNGVTQIRDTRFEDVGRQGVWPFRGW